MITPIIVLNWNGLADTKECIESVLNLKDCKFHIFLLDNNSSNQEGIQLKEYYSDYENIDVILYGENLGFAKAHIKIWEEVIMSQSNTRYIALLNNDTVVDSNWLVNLIQAADENQIDIAASKMINYFNRSIMDNAGHKMLNTGEILPIGHEENIENFVTPMTNMGGCAGGCLYRTTMLREIGFFDPHFSTGYEDAELGLRATISGYNCQYVPNAIVYHKQGQSIKKVFNLDYSIMIHSSILYSYFKLMPLTNILISFPSILFKNLSIFIIDCLFMRWNYLKIWYQSWKYTITNSPLILKKRREFFNLRKTKITPFMLSKRMQMFLIFDIKRFWNSIIMKKETALDQY